MKKVLSIAGSDSGGGAGIQADLKTFSAFGVYGMSVITAVTAQNTVGVSGFEVLPANFVGRQIDMVMEDIGADAVKTGMLADKDIIYKVIEKVREYEIKNLVVDPVLVATSGDSLVKGEIISAFNELFPLAAVVTPNIPEAEEFLNIQIRDVLSMRDAARAMHEMGVKNVIIKGGHLMDEALDILYDGKNFFEYRSPKIHTNNTHGTGCTFSAAIAACLAKGYDVPKAVKTAKNYITRAIETGFPLGRGHGPVNHLCFFEEEDRGDV